MLYCKWKTSTMKKKLLNLLKYLSFLGVGLFLVWWSLHQIPADKWEDFKRVFKTANYWLFIPVFFILSASHVLRALRWKMLIHPMGFNPSFANTFFAVMIGYLANLAVPRLGEVLKCTILAKYEHVPADKLIGTIVAERAFDVLCLLLIFVAAFALQFDIIGEYGMNLLKSVFLDKAGSFDLKKLMITGGILLVVIVIIRMLLRKYDQIKIVHKIHAVFSGILQGLLSVKDMKHKWQFILCSIGIWALYLLGTWVGFYGTTGTAGLPFEAAVSALAFASIGMILTPGGIGAYAFFMAKILQQNGINFEIGFANGTLQWFAQFIIIIIVGFLSLGILPWYNKKNYKHEAVTSNP